MGGWVTVDDDEVRPLMSIPPHLHRQVVLRHTVLKGEEEKNCAFATIIRRSDVCVALQKDSLVWYWFSRTIASLTTPPQPMELQAGRVQAATYVARIRTDGPRGRPKSHVSSVAFSG